jgi:hypothetical protein
MDELKFALGQHLKIKASDEEGEVVGRAEYLHAEPAYYVRYKAADGRAVESWWSQSALTDGSEG